VSYYQDLIDSLYAEAEADIDIHKLAYICLHNDNSNSCNSECNSAFVDLDDLKIVNNYSNGISLDKLHVELTGSNVNTCGSIHEENLFEKFVNTSVLNPYAVPFVPKNFNDSFIDDHVHLNTCAVGDSFQDFDGLGPSPYVNSNACLHQCDASVSNNFNVISSHGSLDYTMPDFDGWRPSLGSHDQALVINTSNSITKCDSISDSVSVNKFGNFGNGLSYLDPDLGLYSSDLHMVNELASVHSNVDDAFDPSLNGDKLLHVVSGIPSPVSCDHDQMDVCKYDAHDGVASSYDELFMMN
jgi:hypothetical protein